MSGTDSVRIIYGPAAAVSPHAPLLSHVAYVLGL